MPRHNISHFSRISCLMGYEILIILFGKKIINNIIYRIISSSPISHYFIYINVLERLL